LVWPYTSKNNCLTHFKNEESNTNTNAVAKLFCMVTRAVGNQRNITSTTNLIGIGTNNPSAALQIGNFATSSSNRLVIPGTYNFEQVRLGQIANGNTALEFVNHTSTASSYGIRFSVDVDHGAPGLNLQYAPSSPSYETLNYSTGLHLDLSGRVSIGTTVHPAGYKFAVAGYVIAESVTVKLQSPWGDYVFDKNYALKSLPEVKTYIDQNHHLPEMPSAQEVAKDGQNLGEMNRLLVKKVEELTLYLIEMKAEIKELQNQNQLLKTNSN
jgi:hypothetical protein